MIPPSLFKKLAFAVIAATLVAGGCLLFSAERRTTLKRAPERTKDEFLSEVRRRGIEKRFVDYSSYVSTKLAETRPKDKCRLPWIEELVRRPLEASQQAEDFTARLMEASTGAQSVANTLHHLYSKMDLAYEPQNPEMVGIKKGADPFDYLAGTVQQAKLAIGLAYSRLSAAQKKELSENIYTVTTTEATEGFKFGGEDRGSRVIDLIQRVDLRNVLVAGRHLALFTEPSFIQSLERYYANGSNRAVLRELKTPAGVILIGGDGPNIYKLDQSSDVIAVVDFGGDDIYEEGSVSASRPVLVIIDMKGNDIYRGKNPGIQGGAILGASLLLDRTGNDKYEGVDVAQGSSLSGIGILLDESGDDSYLGDRRVQGQAVNGLGILLDRSGNDAYRAALFAQGLGGPLGAGLLADHAGSDHYFAGGKYPDSYEDSPGFGGWSQGIGTGARDVANGGIGVLLDGMGNDTYEADYFSHGGGYWFGAGFARDFAGDDQRLGSVRTNFDGTPRTQERYLRWGIGFGTHFSAGFVFDDQGNDSYQGEWAAIAYAWDVATGVVFDGEGDDRYHSGGSGVGQARNAGFALLCDLRGSDRYVGQGLGDADRQKGMVSFALLLDRGGPDSFSQPVKNHSKSVRGWSGGLFIDR